MQKKLKREIKGIISERLDGKYRSYQIVTEWENTISKRLNIPIIKVNKSIYFFFQRLNKLKFARVFYIFDFIRPVQDYYLYFLMTAASHLQWYATKNVIPIIVDFWLGKEDLDKFYKSFSNCKLVLISSREIYELLTKNKCPLPIIHFPLSLPDHYLNFNRNNERTIDFLFAGRKDPVFFEYVLKYEKENSEIEYVYQELEGLIPYYISNKNGRLTDNFFSKEGYIDLLNCSKIAFYTTPGLDNTKKGANGFNQVTPRFLELLSAGCFVMGRYPNNPDTQFYNMNEMCPIIRNYEDFKNVLSKYNNKDFIIDHFGKYKFYLNQHLTSIRCNQLLEILKNNKFEIDNSQNAHIISNQNESNCYNEHI